MEKTEFLWLFLFIDLKPNGIELHDGMRDCPYGGNLPTRKLSPDKQIPWVPLGFSLLFCGFASGTQGRKHKVRLEQALSFVKT